MTYDPARDYHRREWIEIGIICLLAIFIVIMTAVGWHQGFEAGREEGILKGRQQVCDRLAGELKTEVDC